MGAYGSSLNILPKTALMKINYDVVMLRPSDLVVHAFDGWIRLVFGEVDFLIKIGPQEFQVTFYVMDIQLTYCCLLGRLWIHVVGVVTSMLHQNLKYVAEGKVVFVCVEKDYVVSHTSSFRYIGV